MTIFFMLPLQRVQRLIPGAKAAARLMMDHEIEYCLLLYSISWSIIKRAAAFAPGMSRCNLCIEEKLCIMQYEGRNLLNKRSEIFAKCRHREKFRAGKFKRARTSNDGADITPPNYRPRDH